MHEFARLSEHDDDTTTFGAPRGCAGSEGLNVRVAFSAWSGMAAEATELPHPILEMQVLQDGSPRVSSSNPSGMDVPFVTETLKRVFDTNSITRRENHKSARRWSAWRQRISVTK